MITKKINGIFTVLVISALISSCSAPYIITTGCVKDDFTIKLVDKNIDLVPDKFFNISDLRVKVNSFTAGKNVAYPNGYIGKSSIETNKISILHNNKTYYGRIAFFEVPATSKTDAVASFYKISLPERYFQGANDGSQSCYYEYTKRQTPTWIIWLSDRPL